MTWQGTAQTFSSPWPTADSRRCLHPLHPGKVQTGQWLGGAGGEGAGAAIPPPAAARHPHRATAQGPPAPAAPPRPPGGRVSQQGWPAASVRPRLGPLSPPRARPRSGKSRGRRRPVAGGPTPPSWAGTGTGVIGRAAPVAGCGDMKRLRLLGLLGAVLLGVSGAGALPFPFSFLPFSFLLSLPRDRAAGLSGKGHGPAALACPLGAVPGGGGNSDRAAAPYSPSQPGPAQPAPPGPWVRGGRQDGEVSARGPSAPHRAFTFHPGERGAAGSAAQPSPGTGGTGPRGHGRAPLSPGALQPWAQPGPSAGVPPLRDTACVLGGCWGAGTGPYTSLSALCQTCMTAGTVPFCWVRSPQVGPWGALQPHGCPIKPGGLRGSAT